MAVVYLTFDSKVELSPKDDATKKFTGKLAPTDWTIADFTLGKNELKIYHNEFFKGAHCVDNADKSKYVINGIVKMTVKPKVAELLLAGSTEWVVSKVSATHSDASGKHTELAFVPSDASTSVSVQATLDKPSK